MEEYRIPRMTRKNFINNLILAAVLLVILSFTNGLFSLTEPLDRARVLCDIFCMSGAVLICVAAMHYISATGMYDSLVWMTNHFIDQVKPKDQQKKESFSDYRERKTRGLASPFPPLIIGGILMAIGLFFLWRFYQLR